MHGTENGAKTQKSEMLSGRAEELTGMETKPGLKRCRIKRGSLSSHFCRPKMEMVAVNMYLSARKTDNDVIK